MSVSSRWTIAILITTLITTLAGAADLPQPTHTFDEALVINNVRRAGRNPARSDIIEALLIRDQLATPTDGSSVSMPGGAARRWRQVQANNDGWINDRALRNGYAFCTYDAPSDTTMLLDARGHSLVYVNGEPRTGDPYRYGATVLPVPIKKGENTFLFLSSRGGINASLRPLPLSDDATEQQDVFFLERDDTLPDVLRQTPENLHLGVVLVNTLSSAVTPQITARHNNTSAELTTGMIPPFSIRKMALEIPAELLVVADDSDAHEITLELAGGESRTIRLPVKNPSDKHRVTFRSKIDGSVQYYGVVPQAENDQQPGLILSLHGAGVEAQRQASCYRPKDFAVLVAPTNRRSFGFDWEDWGRWDAIEVLEHAQDRFNTNPQRQWITGHSMGGHGTWHIGATFPDRFAAVAPSAGWVSFWSYANAREFDDLNPLEQILRRAASGSDTLALKDNYADSGVYILHGDRDDNVPVDQARTMRRELASFHPDFAYYERPGAGHWWGDQCMDWPPLIEFLKERTLPDPTTDDSVRFKTASPSISPQYGWAEIIQQQKAMALSELSLDRARDQRTVQGTTDNVAVLSLDLTDFPGDDPITFEIDGTTLEVPKSSTPDRAVIARDAEGTWHPADGNLGQQKTPKRGGPFKDAFRNEMIFVVGTSGTPEETAALRANARFNGEQWWYRGNGSVDIIDDKDFLVHHDWRDGRNIILFGNAETNAAWDKLIDDEVRVDRTGVTVGSKRLEGDDLAIVMVRPLSGDNTGSVGVVAGTGKVGTRLVRATPFWVSGIGYPDLFVYDSKMLDGDPQGIRAAGFFGNDWTVTGGEIVFPETTQP